MSISTFIANKNKTTQSYLFNLQYAGGFAADFTIKPDWFRMFEVPNKITLENLSQVILSILNWDDGHLHVFRVVNRNYAYIGIDSLIVPDLFENCFSSAIRIGDLDLKKTDQFYYTFDFGVDHQFVLSVTDIHSGGRALLCPTMIAASGPNLDQYTDPQFPEYGCNIPENPLFFKSMPSQIPYSPLFIDHHGVRFITATNANTLRLWRKSTDSRKWKQAVAILNNWELSHEQICSKIECSPRTLYRWEYLFNSFALEGLSGIKPSNRNFHAPKIELRVKQLTEIIHHRPIDFGINRSNWNLASLAKVLKEKYGETISRTTVMRTLNKTNFNLKKARRVLTSPDPNYREKVELLLRTLQSLGPKEMFFFIDEMGPLQVKKYGGARTYVEKGHTSTFPQKQNSKGSIILTGALSATTNQVTWMYGDAKDTSAMIDIIEILYNQHYDMSKLYITWDAASWHSSNELIEWLDDFNKNSNSNGSGPSIEFVPLPSCSQFLDVIESVFSGMKRAVIHHSDYKSPGEMKTAISRHFDERNEYFKDNPKRVGKKIWEVDFFQDYENIKSGNYREW